MGVCRRVWSSPVSQMLFQQKALQLSTCSVLRLAPKSPLHHAVLLAVKQCMHAISRGAWVKGWVCCETYGPIAWGACLGHPSRGLAWSSSAWKRTANLLQPLSTTPRRSSLSFSLNQEEEVPCVRDLSAEVHQWLRPLRSAQLVAWLGYVHSKCSWVGIKLEGSCASEHTRDLEVQSKTSSATAPCHTRSAS